VIGKILQDTIKFKEIHHENRKFKEICPHMNDYTNFIQTLQHKLPQLWYLTSLSTIFQLYHDSHAVLLVEETGVPGENQ
jgi:hypothetical protein